MGTHPIFESDFDCLTVAQMVWMVIGVGVWLWVVILGCVFLAIVIACYCWNKRLENLAERFGLQESLPQRHQITVDDVDQVNCGWCRYWWGDRIADTSEEGPELRPSELEELCDHVGDLQQPTNTRRSFSNRSNSIDSTNIKASPKLNSSRSLSKSPADSLPIHAGGRRLSHDPFLLCQDLQTIEMRRKSLIFEERRKSEQMLPTHHQAALASQKRKKSIRWKYHPRLWFILPLLSFRRYFL